MLGWFADAPDPDGGLLAFRRISDALGTTPWYLRLLRDEGAVAAAAGPPAGDAAATPSTCSCGRPRRCSCSRDDADAACPAAGPTLGRGGDRGDRAPRRPGRTRSRSARGVRRRELFRVAAADVLGLADVERGRGGAHRRRRRHRRRPRSTWPRSRRSRPTRRAAADPARRDRAWAGSAVTSSATPATPTCCSCTTRSRAPTSRTRPRRRTPSSSELRRLLARAVGPDPPLVVDADLRPEGRQGPLVRTLASYEAYYERWSHVWESQALLRADPIAGDVELGAAVRRR